jgi:hypothetical protein
VRDGFADHETITRRGFVLGSIYLTEAVSRSQ